MKWRVFKLGKLKVGWGEKHSIHTCNSRDPRVPATSIVGQYIAVYWNGIEKFSQIIKLEGS